MRVNNTLPDVARGPTTHSGQETRVVFFIHVACPGETHIPDQGMGTVTETGSWGDNEHQLPRQGDVVSTISSLIGKLKETCFRISRRI